MPQSVSKNPECLKDGSAVVELSLAPLGCIYDDELNLVGKVFVCKTLDEDSNILFVRTAYYLDGTVVENYTGSWSQCLSVDRCSDDFGDDTPGFITEFSS